MPGAVRDSSVATSRSSYCNADGRCASSTTSIGLTTIVLPSFRDTTLRNRRRRRPLPRGGRPRHEGADRVIHLAPWRSTRASPRSDRELRRQPDGHPTRCRVGVRGGGRPVCVLVERIGYGDPKKLPMSETDPPDPRTPYCISKLASEQLFGASTARHEGFVDGPAVLQRVRARSTHRRATTRRWCSRSCAASPTARPR